jgi:hypothetical protein
MTHDTQDKTRQGKTRQDKTRQDKITNNKQQTTNNKQQTTNNKQQTTNNKQQTTNNKQQTTHRQLCDHAKHKPDLVCDGVSTWAWSPSQTDLGTNCELLVSIVVKSQICVRTRGSYVRIVRDRI